MRWCSIAVAAMRRSKSLNKRPRAGIKRLDAGILRHDLFGAVKNCDVELSPKCINCFMCRLRID